MRAGAEPPSSGTAALFIGACLFSRNPGDRLIDRVALVLEAQFHRVPLLGRRQPDLDAVAVAVVMPSQSLRLLVHAFNAESLA